MVGAVCSFPGPKCCGSQFGDHLTWVQLCVSLPVLLQKSLVSKSHWDEIKSISLSPTVTPVQGFRFAMDAGHKLADAWPKLVQKSVTTNWLFKCSNFCSQRADLKEPRLKLVLIHGRWGWLVTKTLHTGLAVWQKITALPFLSAACAELHAGCLWEQVPCSAVAGALPSSISLVGVYLSACFWRVHCINV